MDDPFRNKSQEEIKKEALEAERIKKKIKKVSADAKACMNASVFDKYKKSVLEAREGLIKLMKINTDPDPVKFAFFCKACLSKIDAWDMMIDEVEKDAKKGVK